MHRDKRLLAASRAAWIAGFEGRKISVKLVSALMGEVVGAVWRKRMEMEESETEKDQTQNR